MRTKVILLRGAVKDLKGKPAEIKLKEIKITYLDQEKIFKIKKGETKESVAKRLQNTIDKIAHLLKYKYVVNI
jgi:guanylate kinase